MHLCGGYSHNSHRDAFFLLAELIEQPVLFNFPLVAEE